ncbi:MAG: hypothetical protein E2P00_02665 [Acidobacteria bacterium]|nr:MAG: hypothetical protein E2P00_02665 [Acidobacteriota bacterium]
MMKYKQRGYRDGESPKGRHPETDSEREARQEAWQAARKVRHAMSRDASVVLRCADCGYQTPEQITIEFDTECPKCGSPWHNCRNCKHFDTSARFGCRLTLEKAIPSKTIANLCELFVARVVLDATGKRAKKIDSTTSDPRKAFDDLFKK